MAAVPGVVMGPPEEAPEPFGPPVPELWLPVPLGVPLPALPAIGVPLMLTGVPDDPLLELVPPLVAEPPPEVVPVPVGPVPLEPTGPTEPVQAAAASAQSAKGEDRRLGFRLMFFRRTSCSWG